MRSVLFSLLIPGLCFAQAPKPVLQFNKLHHNFGKVAEDKKIGYKFKATNAGTTSIQVRQIIPSCGCTSSMVGQWHLKPGESTEVEINFDPKGRQGIQHKSIQVMYDDGGNPPASSSTATLTFEADVVQEIMLSKTAVFFDEMSRSSIKKDTVRLQSGTDKPVKIQDVKVPGAPYLITAFRSEGKDAMLDLTFDGSKVPSGKNSGLDTVTVRTANERMPQVVFDVQWNLRPVFNSVPSRIAWVDAAGKELKATLTLKQVDGKPFKILSAKPTHSLLRVEGVSKNAAPQHELTIYFSSAAKSGAYVERVHFTLNNQEQPEFDVRVSAVLK